MIKFYKKSKILCSALLMFGAFMLTTPMVANAEVLVDPPCETSTCISFEAIDIAKNGQAEFDDMHTYSKVEAYTYPCSNPRPTDVTVHRQIFGDIEKFMDGFCSNQGCEPSLDGKTCQKVGG